jgi:cell division protein FtsN
MNIRAIAFALVLGAAASAAHAQDGTLDRVQNLINTGRLTDARNTLAQWHTTNGAPTSDATPADRARALFLTGVLSSDPDDAEDAFVGVVLTYPSSAVAPEALLRLGQALYTAGETDRAVSYLERLQSDYPGAAARETGALWLTRAQLAAGDAADACGTARESLTHTANANLRTLLEIERDRACAQSGGVATPRAPTAAQPAPAAPNGTPTNALPDLGVAVDGNVQSPQPAPARDTARTVAARTDAPRTDTARTDTARTNAAPVHAAAARTDIGEFAVQTAAFSQRPTAERIAAELRAKGFEARVVTVPGSPLFRVRYGAFASRRDAAAAALRVHDAGFATLIVSDVRLERIQ